MQALGSARLLPRVARMQGRARGYIIPPAPASSDTDAGTGDGSPPPAPRVASGRGSSGADTCDASAVPQSAPLLSSRGSRLTLGESGDWAAGVTTWKSYCEYMITARFLECAAYPVSGGNDPASVFARTDAAYFFGDAEQCALTGATSVPIERCEPLWAASPVPFMNLTFSKLPDGCSYPTLPSTATCHPDFINTSSDKYMVAMEAACNRLGTDPELADADANRLAKCATFCAANTDKCIDVVGQFCSSSVQRMGSQLCQQLCGTTVIDDGLRGACNIAIGKVCVGTALATDVCKSLCTSTATAYDCTPQLRERCKNVTLYSMRKASPTLQNVCACYLPAQAYTDEARLSVATAANVDIAEQLLAATSSYPHCTSALCKVSDYRRQTTLAVCPSNTICLASITNNGGTISINGDVSIQQQCKSTSDALNGAAGSGSGGGSGGGSTSWMALLTAGVAVAKDNPGLSSAVGGALLL